MITPSEHRESLATVRGALLVVLGIAVVAQALVFANTRNTFASILAAIPFVAAVLIVFRRPTSCAGAPLPGTIVFLMIAGNSIAPLYGTLLEGKPLSFSLSDPVAVFQHRAVYGVSLLAAYLIAISLWLSPVRNIFVGLGRSLGTSKLFSVRSVWIIGFIGIGAGLLKFLPLPSLVTKILDGVGFLNWAPYILLIPPYFDRKKSLTDYWPLALLYLFQAGISAGTNSRMGFVGPLAAVASAWLVCLISGHLVVDARWMRKAALSSIAGLVVMSQFVDFSTAMLIERDRRGARSLAAQAGATWDTFLDKDRLALYRTYFRDVEEARSGWKENYVDNPILARFIQIKFDDNCLKRVRHYTPDDIQSLTTISRDKMFALIPGPFLKPLGISIDKEFVNSFSTGDLMESLGGNPVLGRRLTGSIPAQIFAIFGWWYPAVVILVYMMIWIILAGIVSNKFAFFRVSTLGMILAFQVFTDISLDGITNSTGFVFRGAWEVLLLYALVLAAMRFMGEGKLLRPPNLGRSRGISRKPGRKLDEMNPNLAKETP
ncbi:hypothetical protein JIN84_16055 [Luteolibacter yonseiensis]|uniref:Uncharacterized protein n=1 Tax=Luteolibacter yonseiensis TaxID=1144680 RepID=A0A934VD34_9BACT|nr:hypothetical protein [Luteolibacter yonseiensis]MBK1817134.1 hypothetical protein [Luteolibacter yonseiensis]